MAVRAQMKIQKEVKQKRESPPLRKRKKGGSKKRII